MIPSSRQRSRSAGCFDSVQCLILALVVGAVLLVLEAVLIVAILVVPGHIGLGGNFLTFYQRIFLSGATVLMLVEAIAFTAVDICKHKGDSVVCLLNNK